MKHKKSSFIVGFNERLFNVGKQDPHVFMNKFPGFNRISYVFYDINAVLVDLKPPQFDAFYEEAKKHDEIHYCEYDYYLKPCSYFNRVNIFYNNPTHIHNLIRKIHNLNLGSNYIEGIGIKIAMIDSGLSPHPYLPATSFFEIAEQEKNWQLTLEPSDQIINELKQFKVIEDKKNSNISKFLQECDMLLNKIESLMWREWLKEADKWFSKTQSFMDMPKGPPIPPNYLGVLRRISKESKNILDESLNVEDNVGHGTQMAGFIFGRPPVTFAVNTLKNVLNSKSYSVPTDILSFLNLLPLYEIDVLGIVPASELLVIKCFDEKEENTTLSNLLKGLSYAEDKKVNLIYTGWAFNTISPYSVVPLIDKINSLRKKDIFVVCPAGNESQSELSWPAAAPAAIAITSIVEDKSALSNCKFSKKSNYANPSNMQKVSFSAYGGDTDSRALTTSINAGFDLVSGTSVAAAIATGIIAKHLSNLTMSEIKKNYKTDLNSCKVSMQQPSVKFPDFIPFDFKKLDVNALMKSLENSCLKTTATVPDKRFGWGVIQA